MGTQGDRAGTEVEMAVKHRQEKGRQEPPEAGGGRRRPEEAGAPDLRR